MNSLTLWTQVRRCRRDQNERIYSKVVRKANFNTEPILIFADPTRNEFLRH